MASQQRFATVLLVLLASVSLQHGAAALSGPFVLWGVDRLRDVKIGALQQLGDEQMRAIYAQAETIVVFVRNASLGPIRGQSYPRFSELLLTNDWSYLAQRTLTVNPLDFNGNEEIISLVGSTDQQDVEIAALYRDAVNTYGPGKVLGILANDADFSAIDNRDHWRRRRDASADAPNDSTSTELSNGGSTSQTPTDEPMEESFVYIAPGKALMYTTAPPQLTTSDRAASLELREHGLVTVDERKTNDGLLYRFIVTFKVNAQKLILRFRFPVSGGYWSLSSVELEELTRGSDSPTVRTLPVVGKAPSAPLGFSYKCASSIKFRLNSTVLTIENIQVQPVLVEPRKFSEAYDCVGFATGGILSGLFVVTLLIIVLTIGLTCILDIKTPNKFENNRGKQLTFAVQE